ncbi:hypothetical protein WJX72_011265 [[Myrmecia] bisecta]|uniref:MYND-type domain-containing protein n=1 Tax=[Myrmecia] bisecta TaxID=41462 RepID=A0AAW1Q0T3_9CHLO
MKAIVQAHELNELCKRFSTLWEPFMRVSAELTSGLTLEEVQGLMHLTASDIHTWQQVAGKCSSSACLAACHRHLSARTRLIPEDADGWISLALQCDTAEAKAHLRTAGRLAVAAEDEYVEAMACWSLAYLLLLDASGRHAPVPWAEVEEEAAKGRACEERMKCWKGHIRFKEACPNRKFVRRALAAFKDSEGSMVYLPPALLQSEESSESWLESIRASCAFCKHEGLYSTLRKCSRCREVEYCCKECQVKHWKLHKETCQPKAQASSRSSSRKEKRTGRVKAILHAQKLCQIAQVMLANDHTIGAGGSEHLPAACAFLKASLADVFVAADLFDAFLKWLDRNTAPQMEAAPELMSGLKLEEVQGLMHLVASDLIERRMVACQRVTPEDTAAFHRHVSALIRLLPDDSRVWVKRSAMCDFGESQAHLRTACRVAEAADDEFWEAMARWSLAYVVMRQAPAHHSPVPWSELETQAAKALACQQRMRKKDWKDEGDSRSTTAVPESNQAI